MTDPKASQNILITGGSGMIGTALTKESQRAGHSVRHLGRKAGVRNGIVTYAWDLGKGTMDAEALVGVHHIIHLAGAGIADKRWTRSRVEELIASRAGTARLLLSHARRMKTPPLSIVSAAGINYYGAVTTDHVFTETDPPGGDTIGRISREWEQAVDEWGGLCRTVKLRTPVVLSPVGGALAQLAAPVRWGLGAPLGSGRQWMPWVHLDDLVAAYLHAIHHTTMEGAYNLNCGNDISNREMMRDVARALAKPFFLPSVPGFMLRLVLGDLASILLEGSRVSNAKLLGTGFKFSYTTIDAALQDLLGR